MAEFEKAGLTKQNGLGGGTGNGYATVNFSIAKGKMKGEFYLVRPAAEATSKSSLMVPAETADYKRSVGKAAFTLDKEADVLFSIQLDEGGTVADAQKLLDSIIKKAP